MKLNPIAQKVLQFLADEFSDEYGCYGFAGIMSGAGINDRKAVRRACRLLARKGFARYERSLWSDDGEPRGAGYGATKAGVEEIYGSRGSHADPIVEPRPTRSAIHQPLAGSPIATAHPPRRAEGGNQREGTMSKFRKKPVVIEAFQFLKNHTNTDPKVPMWFVDAVHDAKIEARPDHIIIKTLEGEMRGDIGDWIIQGVKGEIYPCKPDIFEATYDPA